jgi:CrcB protein
LLANIEETGMKMLFAVALGGALGSMARYLTSGVILRLLGPALPYGTLAVNIMGGFMMGFLVEALALKFQVSPAWRGFLTVGILGGFTTFSAFSLEVALMIERNSYGQAALYTGLSVILSVGALFLGLILGRTVIA